MSSSLTATTISDHQEWQTDPQHGHHTELGSVPEMSTGLGPALTRTRADLYYSEVNTILLRHNEYKNDRIFSYMAPWYSCNLSLAQLKGKAYGFKLPNILLLPLLANGFDGHLTPAPAIGAEGADAPSHSKFFSIRCCCFMHLTLFY